MKTLPGTEKDSVYVVIAEGTNWAIAIRPFLEFRDNFVMCLLRVRFQSVPKATDDNDLASCHKMAREVMPFGWAAKTPNHCSFVYSGIPIRIEQGIEVSKTEENAQVSMRAITQTVIASLSDTANFLPDELVDYINHLVANDLMAYIITRNNAAAVATAQVIKDLGMTPPPPHSSGAAKAPPIAEVEGAPKKAKKKTASTETKPVKKIKTKAADALDEIDNPPKPDDVPPTIN